MTPPPFCAHPQSGIWTWFRLVKCKRIVRMVALQVNSCKCCLSTPSSIFNDYSFGNPSSVDYQPQVYSVRCPVTQKKRLGGGYCRMPYYFPIAGWVTHFV